MKLIEIDGVKGYKTCPKWLKDKFRKAVYHYCQICHFHEDFVGKLQIHRLKRGNSLGLYTLVPLNHKDSNIKVICKNCHKKLHSGEYTHVRCN